MKVMILGAGKRGLRLAQHLAEESNDVVIIDTKEKLTRAAMDKIDCIAFPGSGTSLEDLSDAGTDSADAFVALTGDDEVNLVACALASHEFQVPLTIASIRNISYTGSSGTNSNLLGITHIVNTDYEIASDIYDEIERGLFSDIISLHDSKLVVYNLVVGDNPEFCNLPVIDLRAKVNTDCLIVAIYRDGESLIPSGDTMVLPGDTISLVMKPEDSQKAVKITGRPRIKPQKIVIVGATTATKLLLGMFPPNERSKFAVIDRDEAVCEEFAREFPEALIINGDIADEDILEDEGLDSYDLLVSTTSNDELNIIIASYCKQIGFDYSIAVVRSNNNYTKLARHMGIDSIVSSQEVTVDSITRYLHGTNVASVHSLFDAKIEVFEYMLGVKSKALAKKLRQFNMKGRGLIAGVTKPSGVTLIPNGEYRLEAGDILVLIVRQEKAVSVMRMFE